MGDPLPIPTDTEVVDVASDAPHEVGMLRRYLAAFRSNGTLGYPGTLFDFEAANLTARSLTALLLRPSRYRDAFRERFPSGSTPTSP